MEKIKEQPDTNAKMMIDLDKKLPAEGEKEVKILVANLTDGKDDSYIKQVEETSGNDVQISQNSKDGALADDCIAVNDETENGKAASSLIISNIVEDPQSGSSLNVNYADFTGPVENLNPTDSPFANPGDVCYGAANNSNNFSSLNNFVPTVANSFPWFQVSSTDPRFVSSLSSSDSLLAIENVKNTLYNHGYTEEAISEISGAMNTLAKYRMLGIYNDIMVNNSNPHLGSALVVAIPVPAESSYLMTPGEINEGIYTPTSILSNMGAAYDSVATSTPLGIGSSVFVPIGSLCNQMSSMGIGPNFISPNTSRSSDHFLVEGEANAPEQFHSASSIIDSQSAAALPSDHFLVQNEANVYEQSHSASSIIDSQSAAALPSNHFLVQGEANVYEQFHSASSLINSQSVAALPSDHFFVHGEANVYEQFHSASSIIDSQSAAALPSDHFLVQSEANVYEQSHSASSIIHSQSAAALPVNENSFGFGSGLSSRPANLGRSPVFDNQVKEKIQFEVPEDNVGAIIGYGGNIIKEIQRSTGTFIYISNKIRYIPGSRNRIVTIIGLPPAVSTARYLIERRLSGKD